MRIYLASLEIGKSQYASTKDNENKRCTTRMKKRMIEATIDYGHRN